MDRPMIKQRIKRIRTDMSKADMDTIIILSDANRRYLSGYTGEDGIYDETAGLLVITQTDLILAADPRYDTQAANEAALYRVVCYREKIEKDLCITLNSLNASKVGIEFERLTHHMFMRIQKEALDQGLDMEFVAADDILKDFRMEKDDQEIAAVKAALEIAETSFLQFRKKIVPGMTEKAAAWCLEKKMRYNGADTLSFPVIAASGENSALPHAIPGNRQFRSGEPLLFDFGVRLNGYCSDTTRTLVLGEPDTTFKEAYDILFNAQDLAVRAIQPGISADKIDKTARDYIDSTRFKGRFGHSLGHGVGIAIHEAPRLSTRDKTILNPGMVVTVEPGIYLPGWGGIRLENMVLVTDSGAEVLNTMGYDDYILDNG
ncbi:MAG: aminopeptidase P family protein [Thermodesulfobacteriota bacterium]|nr:aminopeptidase P family protein [Thermodesulfobacteriota bacterium]